MYYGETEQIDLGMEEAIYDEEIANEYLKKIANDIKTLEKKFEKPLNQPIKVYIIQKSLDTGMYIGEDAIYCTAEDIESNRYRLGLVRACYNLTEPAIIHGLVGYIFEEEVDLHKQSEYYDTAEDLSMLGLFGGRFYEEWNTEEELQIAKETATALVSYFIEQDRAELILSGEIGLNEKREWLKSIGVNRTYENQYEFEFNTFIYSKSGKYSLIINSDEASYYMNKVKYLSTVKEVEVFLDKDAKGRVYLLNYLEQNAPNNFKFINKDVKPEYYFLTASGFRGDTAGGSKINLGAPVHHLHEYTHTLTGISFGVDKLWMQEGIAEYLSRAIYPDNYMIQLEFEGITADHLPEESDYYANMMAYYKAHGGAFLPEVIDTKLYVDACAYASFNSVEKLPSDRSTVGKQYSVASRHQGGGNELSYNQASSFTGYLIDQFSLDTYLGYCIGDQTTKTFEEVFGITYEEAKEAWLNKLNR